MKGYTIFTTYLLVPNTLTGIIEEEIIEQKYYNTSGNIPLPPTTSLGEGNSKYIHCNYINKLFLDTEQPYIQEIVINFPDELEFKFLSDNILNGSGFTANKIYGLIQIVNNEPYNSLDEVIPDSKLWRKYNLTNQIPTHILGELLTPAKLCNQMFKIPLNDYNQYPIYSLNEYINYSNLNTSNGLSFGDETFFLGNVETEIKAVAYTTDIAVQLNMNEYNSSTNSTWNGNESVIISEIGIYDENHNLVAIGKLNNPIVKDSTLSRTIVFNIDF